MKSFCGMTERFSLTLDNSFIICLRFDSPANVRKDKNTSVDFSQTVRLSSNKLIHKL